MTLSRGPLRARPTLTDSEKGLSRQEVAAMLEVAGREAAREEARASRAHGHGPEARRRDRHVLRLLLLTGLRASELARLRVGDLRFGATPTLSVRGGKKRPRRHVDEIPLPASIAPELARWAGGRAPEAPLFVTRDGEPLNRRHVWAIVRRLATKAGLRRRIHPHSCRHYFVTTLAAQLEHPLVAAKLARVRNVQTLLTYFHLERSAGTLRALRLPPARPLSRQDAPGSLRGPGRAS